MKRRCLLLQQQHKARKVVETCEKRSFSAPGSEFLKQTKTFVSLTKTIHEFFSFRRNILSFRLAAGRFLEIAKTFSEKVNTHIATLFDDAKCAVVVLQRTDVYGLC